MDPKEIIAALQLLTEQFAIELQNQSTEQSIRDLQATYLSKKGKVGELQQSLGKVAPEHRKDVGQAFNTAKQTITKSVTAAIDRLAKKAEDAYLNAYFDVTLPGRATAIGTMHPINIVMQDIVDIFTSMGFDVAQGPEVETEEFNFTKLNFPDDHPARDMQDTLFIEEGKTLLRTHMSPVQIRAMLSRPLPIQIVAPGAVFRRDDDPTHSPMFSQIEGLLVDKGVHFGHLKGVLNTYIHQVFGADIQMRVRPSFFPFTEPSVEVDIQCIYCKGKGCRLCSQTGWIEILGAGMVDPNVLEGVGIDSEVYSGFAFGIGVDRVAMMKYEGITSIKLLYENDPRFLERFRR
jgi:phenylalanyl-tRNA synthetase alpha chain